MNSKEYTFEIIKSALWYTLITNILLFILWKFSNIFPFAPTLNLIFNTLILPTTFILIMKNSAQNYKKKLLYLNYFVFALCILASIFLSLITWILDVEKNSGIYGRNNIDSGTWMVINLEMLISLGILGIGLLYEQFKSVRNWIFNTKTSDSTKFLYKQLPKNLGFLIHACKKSKV